MSADLLAQSDLPFAAPVPAENTVDLLRSIRAGDDAALDRLCERYLPRLRRWAAGRLPRRARDLTDTDDLVQDTVIRALKRIRHFVPRHDGAFQANLRRVILNRIRDEARRVRAMPLGSTLESDSECDPGPSPLEEAVGRECVERYEAGFARLGPDDQQAVVLRLELHYDYREIAEALGKPSADAARMAVSRAVVRLAREMRRGA